MTNKTATSKFPKDKTMEVILKNLNILSIFLGRKAFKAFRNQKRDDILSNRVAFEGENLLKIVKNFDFSQKNKSETQQNQPPNTKKSV